jgi:thiol-disulfide isomerase/thioredoxin
MGRCRQGSEIKMQIKTIARILIFIVATVLLLRFTGVSIRRPSHPYQAPDFSLLDLDGNSVRLSTFHGKAIVLNLWASWCAPCRAEIPWFIELQKKHGPQGLQVIGLLLDDDEKAETLRFVRRTGINYPVLLGNSRVISLYGGADIVPTTYYISRDGTILAVVKGVISEQKGERLVAEALGKSPTDASYKP